MYILTFYLTFLLHLIAIHSDILSGIYSDIISGILSGIYSDILSGIYADILSAIYAGIYLSSILTFFLASILASYRAFYLTVSLTWAGWGPTVPTEIRNSQFISEEEEKKPSTGSGTKNVQPNPYPEPTGRSIRPIHTPSPDQNAGDPDRSIHPDHRGPIHSRILTQPFLLFLPPRCDISSLQPISTPLNRWNHKRKTRSTNQENCIRY